MDPEGLRRGRRVESGEGYPVEGAVPLPQKKMIFFLLEISCFGAL